VNLTNIREGSLKAVKHMMVPEHRPNESSARRAGLVCTAGSGDSLMCPVCLNNFTTQEVGTSDTCDHTFCVLCLKKWFLYTQNYPLARQKFNFLLVTRRPGGKIIRSIPVEPSKLQREHDFGWRASLLFFSLLLMSICLFLRCPGCNYVNWSEAHSSGNYSDGYVPFRDDL
jgi:hypothetical protein